MKKVIFITAFAVAIGLIFSSCDEKKNDKPTDYENFPYSALTVEQQKDKLMDESDAILKKLSDLSNGKAVELVKSLNNSLGTAEPDIEEIIDINNIKDFIHIKEFKGEYTWNKSKKSWDYTTSDTEGKVTFNLPSKIGGASNDGKIEVSGTGRGSSIEDLEVEIPKDIKVRLLVNNSEVGSITIKADGVNAETIAKSAELNVKLDSYSIAANASKESESKIKANFKFSKGSDVIIEAIAGGEVDFYHEYEYTDYIWDDKKQTYVEVTETDIEMYPEYISEEVKIGDDIAIVGYMNLKKIDEEREIAYKEYEKSFISADNKIIQAAEKKYEEDCINIENKYTSQTLVSRKDKTKIATIKYKLLVEEDEYTDWDGTPIVYYNYSSEMVLVFNDNTEMTADVFFGPEFKKTIESWEEFIENFQ